MTARIRAAIHNQDDLLPILIWLMVFFYAMDFVGSALQSLGVTETQIGRDLASRAFHDIFLVFITVAKAGGDAWQRSLNAPPSVTPDDANPSKGAE